jgi:hypothetical protein
MPGLTAGKRLVQTLNKTLAPDAEWLESELVALGIIEGTADRVEVLKTLFDAEVAKVPTSTRRVTELAAEIRQCEAGIVKVIASLDPQMQRPKSARHVAAANSRWARQRGPA